jgi:branched-chain amino acid transport system permease protein
MSLHLGMVHVGLTRLITFLIAVALTLLLLIFLYKLRPGRAMRAVSENNTASWLIGINVQRTYLLAFGVATGLAGASGALISTVMYTFPMVGFKIGLKAFCIWCWLGNIQVRSSEADPGPHRVVRRTYVPEGSGWAEDLFHAHRGHSHHQTHRPRRDPTSEGHGKKFSDEILFSSCLRRSSCSTASRTYRTFFT